MKRTSAKLAILLLMLLGLPLVGALLAGHAPGPYWFVVREPRREPSLEVAPS